jgi:hypothetical protein
LIATARLNRTDPRAWLADTLARIPDDKITKADDLLPWQWNVWRSGRTVADPVGQKALMARSDQLLFSRSMRAASLFRARSSSMASPQASCRSCNCFSY